MRKNEENLDLTPEERNAEDVFLFLICSAFLSVTIFTKPHFIESYQKAIQANGLLQNLKEWSSVVFLHIFVTIVCFLIVAQPVKAIRKSLATLCVYIGKNQMFRKVFAFNDSTFIYFLKIVVTFCCITGLITAWVSFFIINE